MITRRRFIEMGAAVSAAAFASKLQFFRGLRAEIPGGTLPPDGVNKFVLPLVKPPAMPISTSNKMNRDLYRIAVRQFQQRILKSPHQLTTVWSYGSVNTRVQSFKAEPSTTRPSPSRPTPTSRCWSSGSTSWSTPTATICRTCCRSIRRCTGPIRRAARRCGTCGRSSPTRRGPTPVRCRSSRTCTGRTFIKRSDGYPEAWFLPRRPTISRRVTPRRARTTTSTRDRRRWASTGIPAAPCSTTATTSGPPRSGITTTRWA